VNNKGHVHIRVSCDQQLLIVYKQISYGQTVYQLFKTSWILLKEEPVELNEKSVNKCKYSLDSFDKDLIRRVVHL
jgi:hypothetical protein